MEDQNRYCPECGSQEDGYFCRNCGALLTGEDNVLCPRCHHIVPNGKFCNQCGQGLSGIGLHLRQLALAGDTFWVASGEPTAAVPTSPPAEAAVLEPDESVELVQADLPDWLREIPAASSAAAPARSEEHIYPALKPIEAKPVQQPQRRFLVAVLLLMLVLLVGIVFMAILVLSNTI
jgi:RNA polymerase subunit RPABC4/transcription elongation factor Spt4